MKKGIVVVLVGVLLLGGISFSVSAQETYGNAAALSFCLGAGTGEWLVHKASFGSCLIEHLISGVPIIGQLNWIGSIIDAYKGVGGTGEERANLLFTTFDL